MRKLRINPCCVFLYSSARIKTQVAEMNNSCYVTHIQHPIEHIRMRPNHKQV